MHLSIIDVAAGLVPASCVEAPTRGAATTAATRAAATNNGEKRWIISAIPK